MARERGDAARQIDRWSYLWLAIGALLGFAWAIPLTVWLGSIFMLRFARTQQVWRGVLIVWLVSYATMGITLRAMLPFPLPMYLVIMALSTLLTGALPYLADRLLAPRLSGFVATLVFPLAMTAMDFLGATTNPMGSIGAFAYSQNDNLALMQLASLTGMWGITFLISWLASVVNWAWERGFAWPAIRRGAAIYSGLLLLVLLFGSARLVFVPASAGTVRVHGITVVDMRQNWPELNRIIARDGWEAMRQRAAQFQDRYFAATEREARAGAQLVLWPELAVMVAKEDAPAFMARAQQVARASGIYLAMSIGTVAQGAEQFENKLIILDPAGSMVLEHYKYGGQLFEPFKPGDGILRTVDTPFGTLSGIICWDTDFQGTVRQAGRNGTDILLSPSLEWRGIDPMHAYIAVYRAIENGVVVVRQADNGLSIVADPYGRVVAAMDHFTASERVMVVQVPAQSHVFTLYPIVGDLFGWLAIAGLAGMFALVMVRRGSGQRHTLPSRA